MNTADFECPHCGETVKSGARHCRHCGADDECGWNLNDTDDYDADEEFDYDEFIAREFPDSTDAQSHGSSIWIHLEIIAILGSLVATLFFR